MLWSDTQDEMTSASPGGAGAKSQTFGPYSDATAHAFLDKVGRYGMTVSGSNPWRIDANQHGIILQARRDGAGNVTVTILEKNFYVSNAKIWAKVEPLMPKADAVVGVTSVSSLAKWDKLATALEALDMAMGVELRGPNGRVLGIVGDDWTAPAADASSTDKLDWLEKAEARLKESAKRIADLPKEQATRAANAARTVGKAIDKAVGDLIEHGAMGEFAPDARERAVALLKENKGTIAALGAGYGIFVLLALGIAVYAFTKGAK